MPTMLGLDNFGDEIFHQENLNVTAKLARLDGLKKGGVHSFDTHMLGFISSIRYACISHTIVEMSVHCVNRIYVKTWKGGWVGS